MNLNSKCPIYVISFRSEPAFSRNTFYDVPFVYDGSSSHAIASISNIYRSGTFEYYVVYPDKSNNGKKQSQAKSGFFQIPPQLNHPLDGIAIKTFVPKWLGPLSTWKFHIERTSDLGYNMVHFCPLQQRGISNSPYSIYDQLQLSDDLFTEQELGTGANRYDLLNSVLKEMSEKYHIDSVIDIVWNHTACNSEWIRDHPDAGRATRKLDWITFLKLFLIIGYNLENSPHLKAAFELDQAILDFSAQLESEYGLDTLISSEDELKRVLNIFRQDHLPKYRLWEFFVVPVELSINELLSVVTTGIHYYPTPFPPNLQKFEIIKTLGLSQDKGKGRNSWKVSLNIALSLFHADIKKFRETKDNAIIDSIAKEYRKALNNLNLERYKSFDSDMNTIMSNIENRVKYERLSSNGPKIGRVCAE